MTTRLATDFIGSREFIWRRGPVVLNRAQLVSLTEKLADNLARLPPGARLLALPEDPLQAAVAYGAARIADRPLLLANDGEALPRVIAGARPALQLCFEQQPAALPAALRVTLAAGEIQGNAGSIGAFSPASSPVSSTAYESAGSGLLDADLIVFTSGSTGEPKAIGHRWNSLDVNSDELSLRLELDAEDHFAAMLPVFHLYGFLFNVAMALRLGADLTASPESVFSPGFLSGSPATVAAGARPHLISLTGTATPRPPRLRRFVSSGGPLAPGDSARLENLWGLPVENIYGSSECMMISVNNPARGEAEQDLGLPLPSCQWRLGEDDELRVRTEKLAVGYEISGRQEALAQDKAGYFRSGDVARATPRGYQISGRLATTINVGGKKVAPEAVEAVLRTLPGIRDAAVCAYADPAAGERVAAILSGEGGQDTAALRAQLIGRLAAHELPRRLLWVEALPRLDNGKLDRQALQQLLANHLRPV